MAKEKKNVIPMSTPNYHNLKPRVLNVKDLHLMKCYTVIEFEQNVKNILVHFMFTVAISVTELRAAW